MGQKTYLLPRPLVEKLTRLPETAMETQTVSVLTGEGRRYNNVIVNDCQRIVGIYGFQELPFDPDEIVDIEVTYWIKPENYDPLKMTYFGR